MPATTSAVTTSLTADAVLSPYIYVFYAAFLVAFLFTPIMRQVAMYYGIIDRPDRIRKIHSVPVAYLGGVAVFLGWIAGLALSQFVRLHRTGPGVPPHPSMSLGIIAAAVLIVLLGLWDDVRKAKPHTKILGQLAAALLLLYSGLGTRCTEPLLMPLGQRLQIVLGWPAMGEPFFPDWFVVGLSSLLVIFFVIGCCNATNLMDGLDGLCGGVTAIIAAGYLFIAVHLAAFSTASQNANLDALRVILALALLGASLGFIPYNFNPASIFMGDTGSMFLGFCCATMIVLMGEGSHPKWFLASMVVFALPVLDTALAFARRWVNRRPFFSADRHHFHHQLLNRGYTIKQAVLISYALAIGFALLGCAIIFMRTRYAVAIYLVVFGSIIVAAYKMGMIHERAQVTKPRSLTASPETLAAAPVEPGTVLEIQSPTQTTAQAGSLARGIQAAPGELESSVAD